MFIWMRCSLLLLCLLLSACASSVTPSRYMLPSDPLASTARQPEGTLIVNALGLPTIWMSTAL
ncbi:hypothetical protein HORIV_32860 [Vreelandella olivaria]|uniref:Uncharacterized protein n=1 Tax=Vreelandella olivaria TaxID=390919 RepID=A0ABN5WWW1_9GAMM|nr:hypothetical protein HORIV_32860 [Halomonas olivaria]